MAKSKYELTISTDYVPDWGIVEAVREIFQNALDNEVMTDGENKMFVEYNEGTQELKIGNKNSLLTLDSLLMGFSSKRGVENTIGRHGEGYKVAFMVLLREGKTVTVENYGAKELWTTRLVKARRYNYQLVPEVVIEKGYIWSKKPNNDLTITINGITKEDYAKIKESNLHIKEGVEVVSTSNGSLLLNTEEGGNIYVNGLFVCNKKNFKYGYNLNPVDITLDRDRKVLESVDLGFATAKIWADIILDGNGLKENLLKLIIESDKFYDVKYLSSIIKYNFSHRSNSDVSMNSVKNTLKDQFVKSYGSNAIPVSSNAELNDVLSAGAEYEPVLVNTAMSELLVDMFETPVTKLSAKELLVEFRNKVLDKLSEELLDDLEEIIEML